VVNGVESTSNSVWPLQHSRLELLCVYGVCVCDQSVVELKSLQNEDDKVRASEI
jgi:hypothetical protein